jgi:membrane dipeptidase
MKKPLIVDGHEDLAYNAVFIGLDPSLAAEDKRQPLSPGAPPQRGGIPMVGIPNLLKGNVRVVFATLYANPATNLHAPPGHTYTTPAEAEAQGRNQLNYYLKLAQTDRRVVIIRSQADLERVLTAEQPVVGFVILMEGADPIVQPTDASRWFADGVRIVGTSWGATRYAGGTNAPGPLTPLGRALMPELARAGLILDTSHMAEASFFEALDLFPGTVMASHSNVRALVPTDRQLSDDMIRALLARDGVIGTVLYNKFLQTGWAEAGSHKAAVPLSVAVAHIQHICDLAGDARHVGIGSDFDGGFGSESAPSEIDTVDDLYRVGEALADAGFSDADVELVLSGNWLRLLRRGLPSG